ncbi:MAG: nucleotidyltransferase domain-containing protein [Promethearchaeota archaeon]
MQKKYLSFVKIRYPPSEKRLINLLEQNIDFLINKVPTIEKIILFGSYSRKKPHYGSDVDLLIIVKKRTDNDFEEIYEILVDLSLDYEWSPILLTENRFRKLEKENTPFFKEVIKDGIVI